MIPIPHISPISPIRPISPISLISPICLISLILCLLLALPLSAQEPDSTAVQSRLPVFDELAPEVEVHQSESVNQLLLSRCTGVERKYETVKNGYRIQVYSNNDPKTAAKESSDVAEKVRNLNLGIDIYRTYNAPFWRVRLGNFRTQEDANEVLDELKDVIQKQLPELLETGSIYIVHDEEVVLIK